MTQLSPTPGGRAFAADYRVKGVVAIALTCAAALVPSARGGETGRHPAEPIDLIAFNSSCTAMASANRQGGVVAGVARVTSDATGVVMVSLAHRGEITALVVSDSGDRVAAGTSLGDVAVWSLPTNHERLFRISKVGLGVGAIAFLGSTLVTAEARLYQSSDFGVNTKTASMSLWDLATGEKTLTFGEHQASIEAVCVASARNWVVSASGDRDVKVWDVAQRGALVKTLRAPGSVAQLLALSGGEALVAGGYDSGKRQVCITFWDTKTWAETRLHLGTKRVTICALADVLSVWSIDTRSLLSFRLGPAGPEAIESRDFPLPENELTDQPTSWTVGAKLAAVGLSDGRVSVVGVANGSR